MAQLSSMIRRRPLVTNLLRAIFDTNVIIAGLKTKNVNSPTAELLRRWRNEEFTLLYSDDLLGEYQEKLTERQIPLEKTIAFLAQLSNLGEYIIVTADQVQAIITADPDDDIVLACAVVGQASHLVTYDPHLLNLGATYQNIILLDGLHFLYYSTGRYAAD